VKPFVQTLALLSYCSLASPSTAFELGSPVDCELGDTCFIQQYVDHGSGPSVQDAFCGIQSYDNHKGTDFAVADRAAMLRGVNIVAAVEGTVIGTRDGMVDTAFISGESVKGRECGNGVAIRHADGWRTQYCHMRLNSVAVKKGDRVTVGQTLGRIGMSGQAEFPHLHFQVTRNDEIIDPFDNTEMKKNCTIDGSPLWTVNSDVRYKPGGIMSAGIVDAPPDYERIKQSSPSKREFNRNSPAMVFWSHFYGLEKNDILTLELSAPDGTSISKITHTMTENRAVEMRFGGRKRRGSGWKPGRYIGTATLRRRGNDIATRIVKTIVR